MGYEVIVVDQTVHHHFGLVRVHVIERTGHKFENPHIEKAWCHRVGPHEMLYQLHVKTGHLGNHHHWTILFEVRSHHHN